MAENTPNTTTSKASDNDTTYDHVIKYTGLFGGVQGIIMLVSLVRNKIVSELLGPGGLALINIFNNVIRLVNQSTNFGISFSAVKHVAELFDRGEKEEIRRFVGTVRTWSFCTAVLGALVCLVLCRRLSFWTFETDAYTKDFAFLSLVVGMLAMQGGEIAILKGLKQLKKVALVSTFGAVATLLICAPLFIFFRAGGIVPSLELCNAAILSIHLYYSTKVVPWSLPLFSKSEYGNGLPMLKLGVGYILAGVFGQGAEYIIRTLILRYGELADVGLYNSGYVLTVTYANIVFVAFEADYFPRLSASQHDLRRQNQTVNQQIEVGVLLMAPLLTLVVLAMPVIVPLLFSDEFVTAVPMATCASFYMLFKSLTLPVGYLALAKGDSRMYMVTELIYDVFIALAVPLAFSRWGLQGAGWALSAGGLLDFLMIHSLYRFRYHYYFDFSRLKIYAAQFALFSVAVASALSANPWLRVVTAVTLVLSVTLSYKVLKNETSIIPKLKDKLWRK